MTSAGKSIMNESMYIFLFKNEGFSIVMLVFFGGYSFLKGPAQFRGQGGFVAHRDVLDAFLCRARARLKLGDGTGARADAATACAMAGWKQECWNFRKTRGGESIRNFVSTKSGYFGV